MSAYPTFTRYCCGFAMVLRRKLANGNEELECRHCNQRVEVTQSGYAMPKSSNTTNTTKERVQ